MSKISMVIRYMTEHTGITQLDAYDLCKATRLSAIIWELKNRGFEIKTIMHQDGKTRYAEYQFTPAFKKEMKKVTK